MPNGSLALDWAKGLRAADEQICLPAAQIFGPALFAPPRPQEPRHQVEAGAERVRQLMIAGTDAAEMFDIDKQVLNQVPAFIRVPVVRICILRFTFDGMVASIPISASSARTASVS